MNKLLIIFQFITDIIAKFKNSKKENVEPLKTKPKPYLCTRTLIDKKGGIWLTKGKVILSEPCKCFFKKQSLDFCLDFCTDYKCKCHERYYGCCIVTLLELGYLEEIYILEIP